MEMLALPKDVVVVSAKRRGPGQGGWSKKNPFLPDVRHLYFFHLTGVNHNNTHCHSSLFFCVCTME